MSYGGEGYGSTVDKANENALEDAKKKGHGSYYPRGSAAYNVYAKGGLATTTGPAWLDGSPQDPERVLSPYQTKLFETMVSALERMSTIAVPSMSNYGGVGGSANSNMSFGDIIVNVDNLDTDDDYEELARKVSEILMERIGRTTVVGGIRITSI